MTTTLHADLDDGLFAYAFFGEAVDRRSRHNIKGIHVFAATPTAVEIVFKEGRMGHGRIKEIITDAPEQPFERIFDITCRDRNVLKAFREREGLQALVRAIFRDNVKALHIKEEVVTVEFMTPLAGRTRGKTNRIKAENPADQEWLKDLKARILKLSKAISLCEEQTMQPVANPKRATSSKVAITLLTAAAVIAGGYYLYQAGYF